MSSDDDASAPGAADADAPTLLSEAQRNEIVDAVKQMVKAGKRYSAVLHGWDLKYNLRKTGTAVRGDMCAIDPRDGQKIFSQLALKRKLQVAVEPSAAPEAGEKRPRARRGFEEYKVDENLERGARRRTVVNYAEKSGASGDRGVPLVSGNLVVRVIEAAELNGDAEKDGVPALDMPAITERMEVSGRHRLDHGTAVSCLGGTPRWAQSSLAAARPGAWRLAKAVPQQERGANLSELPPTPNARVRKRLHRTTL